MSELLEAVLARKWIDLGDELPLLLVLRPHAHNWVMLLLGAVLFFVLPVEYMIHTGERPGSLSKDWWLYVVLSAGAVFVWLTVESQRSRIRMEVGLGSVRVSSSGVLVRECWESPISEFAGLRPVERHHPDWIGNKDEFSILLEHPEAGKTMPLYRGKSRERFAARLERYSALLGLPLLPPSGQDGQTRDLVVAEEALVNGAGDGRADDRRDPEEPEL